MKTSETITKIAAALLAAQKEMESATKGSSNPFYKSKYADYSAVLEACKPALNNNGIVILQPHKVIVDPGISTLVSNEADEPVVTSGFTKESETPSVVRKSHANKTESKGQVSVVETILLHTSGEFISSETRVEVAKVNDPQALGSAITYARRYGLQSLVALPAEDDDGEGAMGRKDKKGFKKEEIKKEEVKPMPNAIVGENIQQEVTIQVVSETKKPPTFSKNRVKKDTEPKKEEKKGGW